MSMSLYKATGLDRITEHSTQHEVDKAFIPHTYYILTMWDSQPPNHRTVTQET